MERYRQGLRGESMKLIRVLGGDIPARMRTAGCGATQAAAHVQMHRRRWARRTLRSARIAPQPGAEPAGRGDHRRSKEPAHSRGSRNAGDCQVPPAEEAEKEQERAQGSGAAQHLFEREGHRRSRDAAVALGKQAAMPSRDREHAAGGSCRSRQETLPRAEESCTPTMPMQAQMPSRSEIARSGEAELALDAKKRPIARSTPSTTRTSSASWN